MSLFAHKKMNFSEIIIVLLCMVLNLAGVYGQSNPLPVTIKGKAISYAKTKMVLYTYTDFITYQKKDLGFCMVDDSGEFEITISVVSNDVTEVFFDLGKTRGILYATPPNNYDVWLPQRTELLPEDFLNPYFKPQDVILGVKNAPQDELNTLIRIFENTFSSYYMKLIRYVAEGQDVSADLKTAIASMEETFKDYNNIFFKVYREYSYGLLFNMAEQQKSKSISDNYFLNRPVFYSNPAYMDLFDQIYDRYFMFYSRTTYGEKIFKDINEEKSLPALKKTLSQDKTLTDDRLLELVILKGLHDEFYDDNFSRSAMLAILDSLVSQTTITEHKEIGKNIRRKVTKLMAGYVPPEFQLYDNNNNLISLSDYAGKYVYLNFCSCQSYACIQEFETLAQLNAIHKDHLQIITIVMDGTPEQMKEFLSKSGYSWKFLHYGDQSSVIENYDIRAYPTYYLIGPDGNLLLSPAPSPRENFENTLFNIMKSRGDI